MDGGVSAFDVFVWVVVPIGGVIAFVLQARRKDEMLERWKRIARERSWELSGTEPRLTLLIEPVTVDITTFYDDGRVGTFVKATPTTMVPVSFEIDRRHARRNAFSLGQPFDSAFIARSPDPDLVRACLTRRTLSATAAIAKSTWGFSLRASPDEVVAEIASLELSGEEMLAIATFVAGVARGGHFLDLRWRKLCDAIEGQSTHSSSFPPSPIVVTRRGRVANIEVVRSSDRWQTWVVCDDRQIELAGIVLDKAPIEEALDRALAAPAVGPYR